MRDTSRYLTIQSSINSLLDEYRTSNPFKIASHLNISIKETNVDPEVFKARVYFIEDKKGIMINSNLDEKTKK
ncbi:MAG: hypothetical protein ACRC7N_02935, partial [Clostridium sp.]